MDQEQSATDTKGLHQLPKTQRFWAVAIGHQTGVFFSPEEAEAAVKGFSGPRRKRFSSCEEAVKWIDKVFYERHLAQRQTDGTRQTRRRAIGRTCRQRHGSKLIDWDCYMPRVWKVTIRDNGESQRCFKKMQAVYSTRRGRNATFAGPRHFKEL